LVSGQKIQFVEYKRKFDMFLKRCLDRIDITFMRAFPIVTSRKPKNSRKKLVKQARRNSAAVMTLLLMHPQLLLEETGVAKPV